jgi:sugar phosphate permease
MQQDNKPIADLGRDLIRQTSDMFRHELDLARAEIGNNLSKAERGAVMMAVALVFALGALVILLMAAVSGLDTVMAEWLAQLIVGGVTAVVAIALAMAGRSSLKMRNLAPTRTIETVKGDARYAKEKTT